jgi:hypothetical protein
MFKKLILVIISIISMRIIYMYTFHNDYDINVKTICTIDTEYSIDTICVIDTSSIVDDTQFNGIDRQFESSLALQNPSKSWLPPHKTYFRKSTPNKIQLQTIKTNIIELKSVKNTIDDNKSWFFPPHRRYFRKSSQNKQ